MREGVGCFEGRNWAILRGGSWLYCGEEVGCFLGRKRGCFEGGKSGCLEEEWAVLREEVGMFEERNGLFFGEKEGEFGEEVGCIEERNGLFLRKKEGQFFGREWSVWRRKRKFGEGSCLLRGRKAGCFVGRKRAVLQESAGIFGENLWFILGASFYIGLGNRGI